MKKNSNFPTFFFVIFFENVCVCDGQNFVVIWVIEWFEFWKYFLVRRGFTFFASCDLLATLFAFLCLAVLGQGEQDHGQLLFIDFAVAVKVASAEDRVLELEQVVGVVILFHNEANGEEEEN